MFIWDSTSSSEDCGYLNVENVLRNRIPVCFGAGWVGAWRALSAGPSQSISVLVWNGTLPECGACTDRSYAEKLTMRIPIPDPIRHSAIDTSEMLLIKNEKKKKTFVIHLFSHTDTRRNATCNLYSDAHLASAWGVNACGFFFEACDHIICNVINSECTGIFLTPVLTGHAPSTDCMIFSKSQDSFSKAVQPNIHMHLRIHSQQAKPKTLSARDKHAICKWAWAEFCNALWEPQLASLFLKKACFNLRVKKKNIYL